jgi:cytochrome c-type biogenesis protein CcmH/NrfF
VNARPTLRPRRLITLVAVALAIAGTSALPAVSLAAGRVSLLQIEPTFMCQVCGEPLNVAQSPEASREVHFITVLIARGDTEKQIDTAMVAQYGPSVMATPSHHGFGLVAYIVPIVAALMILAAAAVALPRWRRRGQRLAGTPMAPESTLSAAERDRLDADLAQFGG